MTPAVESARPWQDPTLPAGRRAELLLGHMTLGEKSHQLTSVMAWTLMQPDGSDTEHTQRTLVNPPGHVAHLILDDPVALARVVGDLQRLAVTRTRLGIPLLVHAEAVSGFLAGGHAVFPTGTGLAATWSPELVADMAGLIRRQMRRVGMAHALSPVLDVALDPRWGRVHETYGEDPYLAAAFGVAYVRALQGDDLRAGVLGTGKHFLGYGVPEGGLNGSTFEGGARRTRDLFAYPFEAAVQLAGLRTVMNSYGEIDGIPAACSPEVLTGLLRDTLGFDGFVCSDYVSIEQLSSRFNAAKDAGEAARLAIMAGLDVELPTPYAYGDALAEEVEAGRLDPTFVDRSVWRVLRAKFELGLFEDPYPQQRIDVRAVKDEGAALSLELSRRSVVLLEDRGLLPLRPGQRVAVVGPHADLPSRQFPAYTFPAWREAVDAMLHGTPGTMLGAPDVVTAWYNTLLDPVEDGDPDALVRARYGARGLAEELGRYTEVVAEPGCELTGPLDDAAFDRAITAARDADVVVLALGGASLWYMGQRTEGEASDTADIALPPAQARLADAVAATGTPLAVVLVQGRAYALPDAVTDAGAILVSSFAGPFGHCAIAEALTGRLEPTGRLPYSIPRHSGQIPVYHHQKRGSGARNPVGEDAQHYLDMPAHPRYPFGYGLGWAEIALRDLNCDAEIDTAGTATIATTVTNTGRPGTAVLQLYVSAKSTGQTRPAQQLAGFARIPLAAGEAKRVKFRLDAAQLGCTDRAREFAIGPGHVEFFLGTHSADRRLSGCFSVTGERRVLAADERTFLSDAAVIPVRADAA